MNNINVQLLINTLKESSHDDDLVDSNAVMDDSATRILIGIDVSGSTTTIGSIEKLKEIKHAYELKSESIDIVFTVVQFNHKIVSIDEYSDLDELCNSDFVIHGGTDLNVFYDFLVNAPYAFDKWYVITDDYITSRTIDEKYTWNYLETIMLVY